MRFALEMWATWLYIIPLTILTAFAKLNDKTERENKMSEQNNITLSVNETAPCEQKIEFKVAAETVSAAFKKAAKTAQKQAQIPGFRVGKAPLEIVAKRYADYILEDVERNLQGAAFEQLSANEENDNLDIVSFGSLDAAVKPENGKEYVFSIQVETAPAIELPDYKTFAYEVAEMDSVEKRVAARLEYLKGLYSDYANVTGAAQKGDMMKVSYESDFALAEDASASLKRAVKADDSWIWLNEPEQFPGIIAALEGKEIGVETEVAIEFPADWREAALQGQKLNYKFKIHEIQRKAPIESDEALAEKVKAESVEKMMADIKDGAEKELEYEKKEQLKGKALEMLLPCIEKAELPKGLVASTVQREFQRIAERLVRSEADVEPFKADREKHMEEAKQEADKYLRKFFVLRKIANVEKLTVSQEEVDAQIKGMCAYMGYKEADVRKMLERNGGTSELQADILMNKALEAVVAASEQK